jgi:hypothetical protein
VKVYDANSTGFQATRTFTIAPSPFAAITANVTHVKAAHILAIRNAVNAVRNYYGLTPVVWAYEITFGTTQICDWPYHIIEFRDALEPVVDIINNFDLTSTAFDIPAFDWLPLGMGRPRADVIKQIYELILVL